MELRTALLVTVLFTAGPAMAQSAAGGAGQNPPAQHQPGTAAKPAQPKADTPAKAPVQAPAEKIDAAKEAAIRHLMDITETSKMGDNIQTYITRQVHDYVGRAIAADRLPKFMDTFSQKFNESAPSSAVTDAVVPIYAKNFSMDDIQGLIHFYESPLGQRVVKTMPEISQESQGIGLEMDQKAAVAVLRGMTGEYAELKQMLPPENDKPAGAAPESGAAPASGAQPASAPKPATAPALAPESAPAPKPAPPK